MSCPSAKHCLTSLYKVINVSGEPPSHETSLPVSLSTPETPRMVARETDVWSPTESLPSYADLLRSVGLDHDEDMA